MPDEDDYATSLRKAAHEALTAHYEPTGLVLHPVNHARVGIDPDNPESIQHAKTIADAFGVPYWLVGIPGYRAPLRNRLRTRLRRLPRRLLTTLPGVDYWGPRETGEDWFDNAAPEPRAGRWFVHVRNYRLGVDTHPAHCGDIDCTEDHG